MNPRKKRRLMTALVCLGLLLLTAIFITAFLNRQAKKKEKKPEISQTTSSESSVVSSYSQSEQTPNKKNYRQARATLERPESLVSEDKKNKVAEALKIAVEDIKKHPNTADVSGTMDNHLSSTSSPMVLTFAMALNLAGYRLEDSQTEVFKSYSDDVLQFICVLSKDGEENSYFVGNYNDYTAQLQIASYHGGNIRVRGD
ncbi:hypothetical protein STRDD11_01645 [Streptococcus sp. DD11]|uniref:hypothetical protein n=1 Tax=Streptococcus sp. DD11 TaxID=1777879 RepID=UPI000795BB6B|nr:hypothetical protein [Streptococcus sp. DD11]KXT83183.1 hypothetical protein STRDD11_01645 [Streptococcus sp. DD11]